MFVLGALVMIVVIFGTIALIAIGMKIEQTKDK